MTRPALLMLLLVLPPASGLSLAPPDVAPTADEIRALYDKGEYNEALKQLSRVLALKGKAAEGVDRYELLMLRAESHLRLKATGAALPALEEAAQVATDPEAAAKARALAILVRRSKNLQYTPKGGGGKGGGGAGPIDITDAERRPEAFEALYEGERAAAQPKVAAAEKGKTLPPIAAAMKAVVPLRDLELAATGKDEETADTLKELVERAHTLMAKGLDDMAKRTERISERANELVDYTVRRNGRTEVRTRRRGLDNRETRELKEVVQTCGKVIESCKELAEGFAEDDEPFVDLEDQARDVGERAHDVLTDNYKDSR